MFQIQEKLAQKAIINYNIEIRYYEMYSKNKKLLKIV